MCTQPLPNGNEMRRRRRRRLPDPRMVEEIRRMRARFSQSLQKAGVYVQDQEFYLQVTTEEFEMFTQMVVVRNKLAVDGGILKWKVYRTVAFLAMYTMALVILADLFKKYTWLLEVAVVVPMSGTTLSLRYCLPTVISALVWWYICTDLINGPVYAKWKAVGLNHSRLIRAMNNARRRLAVVAHTHADEATMEAEFKLNHICYKVVMPVSFPLWGFWVFLVPVIQIWGQLSYHAAYGFIHLLFD